MCTLLDSVAPPKDMGRTILGGSISSDPSGLQGPKYALHIQFTWSTEVKVHSELRVTELLARPRGGLVQLVLVDPFQRRFREPKRHRPDEERFL